MKVHYFIEELTLVIIFFKNENIYFIFLIWRLQDTFQ